MHKEILTEKQIDLLPAVHKFSRSFGLVGGTALALQIGHRQSVDFDLFSYKSFKNIELQKKIMAESKKIESVMVSRAGELTMIVGGVKITFFEYPYRIEYAKRFEDIIRMADLETLAAMKVFALGRRAKWKDYVDLYFIFKNYHSLSEVIKKAEELFGDAFNERIFRNQLAYFDDIDYSEEVIYMPGFEVSEETVKKELIEFSLS